MMGSMWRGQTATFFDQSDGWYYMDDEYPEEGSVGPFRSLAEAEAHAAEAGYQ
jgi:hypothetical protein